MMKYLKITPPAGKGNAVTVPRTGAVEAQYNKLNERLKAAGEPVYRITEATRDEILKFNPDYAEKETNPASPEKEKELAAELSERDALLAKQKEELDALRQLVSELNAGQEQNPNPEPEQGKEREQNPNPNPEQNRKK
jgi:hypothetical protein